MASRAYPRIGGLGKSELHAAGVLRPSRWPRSSLSSVPNSKQHRKSKRDRYWLYKREEPMERIPIEKQIGCKNNQKEQVMSTKENRHTLPTYHRSTADFLHTTMKTKHPFRSIVLLASMLLVVAVPLVAQTPLLRLSAEFQNTSSGVSEASSSAPAMPAGAGGTVVYSKLVPIPPAVDVLYVTFSAQGDVHSGSTLLMNASVNGALIQPLAGQTGGGGGTMSGWYSLLNLPQPTTSTNCNDGGGGTADCHDNTIFFSGCFRVRLSDRPNATVTIKLANLPGVGSNISFYERATIYIDAQTDGQHLCNGVSTTPH
jgi:hypothetical protein